MRSIGISFLTAGLIAGSALTLGEIAGADAAPPAPALPAAWYPNPAPKGGCTHYLSFRSANNGSIAMVRKCRNSAGTTVRANGTVKDLDNNGACGQVHVKYNGYTGMDVFGWACPKGDVDDFVGSYRSGTNIDVYVYDVLV